MHSIDLKLIGYTMLSYLIFVARKIFKTCEKWEMYSPQRGVAGTWSKTMSVERLWTTTTSNMVYQARYVF